ncbi:MAG TPA: acetylornithine transaminase [Virgibacillus sp.]|nr:acetylornithine transaminase [Virgibacillus sp.]
MTALFSTYNRFDLTVAEASGTVVKDTDGKEYLDFGSGIGVCNLGHRHPDVQQAIEEQLNKYWHVSNLYHVPLQEEVAKLLTANSAGDYVFFCNSGAEANEAAIKLARKATGKTKIITFQQSFHGRTFATMAATGQDKVQQGFGPMLQAFDYAPFNDIEAVKKKIDGQTAAVMLEVIQGEGGVIAAEPTFVKQLEQLCVEHDILLIIDEIQTGIGRTGVPFAYQHYAISPDIISTAKGIGNGLPVGAMIAKAKFYDDFGPGSHATTFGGNPLAMAAAKAVLQHVFDPAFLQTVEEKSIYLKRRLQEEIGETRFVTNIKGKGLMIGIECAAEVTQFIPQLMEKGLLVLNAGPHVLRLLPPLTVSYQDIDRAVELISEMMKKPVTT